jgi:hypothetical protein
MGMASLLFCSSFASDLSAMTQEEEIKMLREQVQMLLKRIEELEKNQKELADKQKETEKKIPTNWKAYWKNGFRIEYKDPEKKEDYAFRFRTALQLRYTYMLRDDDFSGGDENYSSFTMRRLRFFVDGHAPNKDWEYFVHVQLEPKGAVNVHDATVTWKKYPFFKIQLGRIKIPAMSMEYWQSGFLQQGQDRTIFTDDSENYWPYSGTQKLKVGNHLLKNGFPIGGMLLFRSQGINAQGTLDMFNKKQFLAYWVGVYNGRDTQGASDSNSDDKLYCARLAFNFLSGSDPNGPLGKTTFYNYFLQGDYYYNTKPALALITSGFWTKDRPSSYYYWDGTSSKEITNKNHDIENYGFDVALLFRYKGFSFDIEGAWEEIIQDPDKGNVGSYPTTLFSDEETWDRLGFRVNVGYFIVPKKWEVYFKYAYLDRLMDDKLEDAVKSGLGLIKTSKGAYAIEDYMQQYVLGVNYFLKGFNHYISAEVSYLTINTSKPSEDEISKLNAQGMSLPSNWDDETENDWRFRISYQFFF